MSNSIRFSSSSRAKQFIINDNEYKEREAREKTKEKRIFEAAMGGRRFYEWLNRSLADE